MKIDVIQDMKKEETNLREVERGLSQLVHGTATYRCDDTRGCIVQLWPPDDEHLCSKHVEA